VYKGIDWSASIATASWSKIASRQVSTLTNVRPSSLREA